MPYFKRHGKSIYGVRFTTKEQEALDKEIARQCAEYDRSNAHEIDAIILWILHEKFGFGKQRLKVFHNCFSTEVDALVRRYEMSKEDKVWLCTRKLKQYGVDISEWNKEAEEK